jgi:hypothetical protein
MPKPHQDPEPPTEHVANLGATLTKLARSSDDRDCLDVFADALNVGTDVMGPLLLTVLVEPLAGAQIAMVGHVCRGMTLQVDADLEVRLIQPWFPEIERDDCPSARSRLRLASHGGLPLHLGVDRQNQDADPKSNPSTRS